MSAQSDNQQMEGVQDPSVESKGKGKAPEGETMEESMDDDSSDESGVEDQAGEGMLYSDVPMCHQTNS
jgi:hypothetical protein